MATIFKGDVMNREVLWKLLHV